MTEQNTLKQLKSEQNTPQRNTPQQNTLKQNITKQNTPEQLTPEQEQILQQDWVKNIKYVPLYNNSKFFFYDQEKGTRLTGTAVFSQTLSKLLIIDVSNKVPYEYAQENLQQLKRMFVPENTSDVYIEQTENLGLHIFLYNDLLDEEQLKQVDQCRFCEIFKRQYYNFEIHIFTPSTSSPKKSIVDVAKPHCDGLYYIGGNEKQCQCRAILNRSSGKTTRVKDAKNNIVPYKIISECQNFVFTKLRASEYLRQILIKTGIDIKFAFIKRFNEAKIKESYYKHNSQNISQKSQNTIWKNEKQENTIQKSENIIQKIGNIFQKSQNTIQKSEKQENTIQKSQNIIQKSENVIQKSETQEYNKQEDKKQESEQQESKQYQTQEQNQTRPQTQTQIQNKDLQKCITLILSLLKDAEIHNYSGTNVKQEITLLPLFRSIMVLPEEVQQKMIEKIYTISNLTQTAKKNYFLIWERVKNTQPAFNDLGIFFTMIKYNRPKKYKDLEDEVKKVQDIFKRTSISHSISK